MEALVEAIAGGPWMYWLEGAIMVAPAMFFLGSWWHERWWERQPRIGETQADVKWRLARMRENEKRWRLADKAAKRQRRA